MVAEIKRSGRAKVLQDQSDTLKFGGGINSAASEDEINRREAADGKNFLLDLSNRELRSRPPFDLLGTAPNAMEIRGGGYLLKNDGTISMFVQAGDTVYSWNGTSFTSIGTVAATAKLRGRREHNFPLDDRVIVTDLNLQEPVSQWDGTTFSQMTENLTGTFLAKYCFVSNERVFFVNVVSNSVATPHMIVGSKRGDPEVLSITNRPSSALAEDDPFFLLAPDLRAIQGIEEAFGVLLFSTKDGRLYRLTGASAKDFAIGDFYPQSFASGDESVRFTGNDILYGRQGRIESVIATDQFGDVGTDDRSIPISDQIADFKDWTVVYNSRLQRVYFFSDSRSDLWVLFKDLAGSDTSPWSRWTTQHALSFQPTFVLNMLDPLDGLEYTYMGDSSGNFYRLEGSGASGDAGSASIQTEFLSALFSLPEEAEAYNVSGWLKYRQGDALTLTLTFEYAGYAVFNETVSIDLDAATGPVYGGDAYYGGEVYYGTKFEGRLTRKNFDIAGQGNEFQVRVSADSNNGFEVNEIGVRLSAAS